MKALYTIGHSNHSMDDFLALLERHGIEAVFDVRSKPYSRIHPHFRYKPLAGALQKAGIEYVFAGKALGARPDDPDCREQGRISFARLAQRHEFAAALKQIRQVAESRRVCLMCAEKEPLSCHRTLLICRNLRGGDLCMYHILADGSLEAHGETEKRMMQRQGTAQQRLFSDHAGDPLEAAYERRIEWVLDRK